MSGKSNISFLPVVFTIGGSDSSGGAGIQADLKTFGALGCYGTCALTAVTAQNTRGVQAVELVDCDLLRQQIDAVATDTEIAATKTGMLGSAAAVEAVAEAVERHRLAPLVVDPVMVAKSGDPLIDDEAVEALRDRLLPLATVLTPNVHEAGRLLETVGGSDAQCWRNAPTDVDAAGDAARAICENHQVPACVVTGVRRELADGKLEAVDVWCNGEQVREIAGPRCNTGHTHGSGCTHSAALAACLARGAELDDALAMARQLTQAAVSAGLTVGKGVTQPVHPLAWLDKPNANGKALGCENIPPRQAESDAIKS